MTDTGLSSVNQVESNESAIERVDAHGSGSWTAQVSMASHGLEEELGRRDGLESIARALSDVAVRAGASMVTGASELGNQLAGVIAARPESGVALWARNGAYGTVLVIEGVLVSGAQLAATAKRARQAGAARVVGAAVLATPLGASVARTSIDVDLFALRELALDR